MNPTANVALLDRAIGGADLETETIRTATTDTTTEAAHLLAEDVREVLLECGLTTTEIDALADAYTRRSGSANADAFLDWISTYGHRW